MKYPAPVSIAELYPEFTKEELEQAASSLRRYLAVLLRMAERMESEGKSINDLAVDCLFDDVPDPL